MDNCQTLDVNCIVVNHGPFVAGQPQKKDIRPIVKTNKMCARSFLCKPIVFC